jgi:hypothetical protein
LNEEKATTYRPEIKCPLLHGEMSKGFVLGDEQLQKFASIVTGHARSMKQRCRIC